MGVLKQQYYLNGSYKYAEVLYNKQNEVIIMKHMKKTKKRSIGSISSVVWIVLALIVIFSGYKFFYPNHVTNTESTADKASSSTVVKIEESNSTSAKSESSTKKTSNKNKIWTSKQDSELATAISSWQQTMGQSYEGTNKNKSVSFGGVSFPDYLSEGQIFVNQQEVSMKWTTSKSGDSDYKVVAAYAGSMYLYLFTFHNDTPEVLVTSQSASDGMNFKVTENAQLVANFEKIATENSNTQN